MYVELERSADSIEIGPPDTGFGGLQPTMISQSSRVREPASSAGGYVPYGHNRPR